MLKIKFFKHYFNNELYLIYNFNKNITRNSLLSKKRKTFNIEIIISKNYKKYYIN